MEDFNPDRIKSARTKGGAQLMVSSRTVGRVLLAVAALMVPLCTITLASVPAGALTIPPFTCSVGGTMTFDKGNPGQGISKDGYAATLPPGAPYGPILISYPSIGGCGSGQGAANYAGQVVRCDKKTPGLPASNPACMPATRWGFKSWDDVLGQQLPPPRHGKNDGSYAEAIQLGTGSFQSPWSFHINGTLYSAQSRGVVFVPAGGACGASELGFQAHAKFLSPHHVSSSQSMTVTLCLGAISGTGLNPGDNFYGASVDQVGIVDSAVIDQATSTVHVG